MDQGLWQTIISFDLVSYIYYTCDYKQYCHVGNTAKQCRLGLFQDSGFAGYLEDSTSTSGGTLCIFGSHTFVPISWMCKKQASFSHISTESEIISLDAGLRLDGIPALDLWDLIVAVLHGNTYQSKRGDPCTNLVRAAPDKLSTRKKSHGMIDDLNNVDFISSNVHSSRQEALLYIFEDNEAVIKMIIKGRSPTMRHVSRTQRVALDWLFDRINLDPKIQIKYIDTKDQLADILTKGSFTRDEWNHLLTLFNISHFSSTDCLEVMSKRTHEDAGEERGTAKSKPMMNLVSRCSERNPNVLASTASESPGKTRCESQNVPLSSLNVQQSTTGRLVMGAGSSDYSEWNTDEKWSSQEWKSGEMLEARTESPVGGQPFTQHTDKFVIDDDDMDSDTATEPNLSINSRSFLRRVNDRLRKTLDRSSKDAMQDIDKRSLILGMFISSTLAASVFMGKNYSEILHSIKNTQNNLTLKQMFNISEKLIVGQSDVIFGVTPLTWKILHGNNYLIACKGLCVFQILCYVLER